MITRRIIVMMMTWMIWVCLETTRPSIIPHPYLDFNVSLFERKKSRCVCVPFLTHSLTHSLSLFVTLHLKGENPFKPIHCLMEFIVLYIVCSHLSLLTLHPQTVKKPITPAAVRLISTAVSPAKWITRRNETEEEGKKRTKRKKRTKENEEREREIKMKILRASLLYFPSFRFSSLLLLSWEREWFSQRIIATFMNNKCQNMPDSEGTKESNEKERRNAKRIVEWNKSGER